RRNLAGHRCRRAPAAPRCGRGRPPQDAPGPARDLPGGLMSDRHAPPSGYFRVGQRLLRGYGPLAVFALMILLLSILVPSKVPEKETVASGGTASSPGLGVGDGSIAGDADVTTDDGGTATGTPGAAATDPGKATGTKRACPDRDLQ